MEYIGEHPLPGILGHFAVVFGFVASLLAVAAFTFATNKRETTEYTGLRKIGRIAFVLHGLSVFTIIGTMFYMMLNQYYEYQYVWAHVSPDLPFKYIFSAFWEGQEGSFLLWMFWHVILGFVLIRTAGKWETPVLATLALVQVFIGSMLLGLNPVFLDVDWKIGSSPFLYLRDVMVNAPIFAQADYLSLVEGNGLNPLLQNYWMTIHPPTLFLGFASTVVPYCYAMAGLWTGEHKAWLKPVQPWALFSAAILGLGILMGGAWAYEALSFGGYWAWDPVENMSLVPWIILVAGLHANLIANATGYSVKSTYLFYLLTFVMIVYSTFLTRSGILGETSVHAFTEMGLEVQLIAFLFTFLLLGLFLFFKNWNAIPAPKKEESIASREFWMFIGTLVLLFSGVLITLSTSLPVYNKLYQIFIDPLYEGGVINDQVGHHNKYQLWIAVFISIISGFSQFLRFREKNWSNNAGKWMKHVGISLALAGVATVLLLQNLDANAWQYKTLLFFSLFTIFCNLDYILFFIKPNLKDTGSAFAHVGFGIMVLGVLYSGLNKEFISSNPFAQRGLIEGFTEEQYKKNILLIKDQPLFMSGYEVTYESDTLSKFTRTFKVNYKKKDLETNEVTEEFDLYPNVLYDKSFTKIAASNPSTKRYIKKDIFTHIASLPMAETDVNIARAQEDSLKYDVETLAIGDTLRGNKYFGILRGINKSPTHPEYKATPGDRAVGLQMTFTDELNGKTYDVEPIIILRETLLYGFAEEIEDLNVKIKLTDETVREVFGLDEPLDFQQFKLKKGEAVTLNGHQIQFDGFNTNVSHPDYVQEQGDIVVSAKILVTEVANNASTKTTEPVYLIRGNKPFNLESELEDPPFVFQFSGINPAKESIDLRVAVKAKRNGAAYPLAIANEVPRSDFIVLEAILFPGINLFWAGTLMLLIGLAVSMVYRMRVRFA
ncbi:MAG: cytochrome c biogenesis protein CcsA [Saprospiraceae bacterium]